MAEPLKDRYNKRFSKDLAERVAQYAPGFQQEAFVRKVHGQGWRDLELKARMSRIAITLNDFLKPDFAANAEVLSKVAKNYLSDGLSGFEYMFLADYIERYGQANFSTAMKALAAVTETGSAEFAIRPFIVAHEDKALKQLKRWSQSSNLHLRRLASEGCRPRLPWALALPKFKQDPAPILSILETLKNDSSEYVRRSVANNLNDISKDHPDTALALAERWLGATTETDWVVKHACRGLLKGGHPKAMSLFGLAPPAHIKLTSLKLSPACVEFGHPLEFSFDLSSTKKLGLLRLEYAIDFVKANGSRSRKVFKIGERENPKKQVTVQKRHRFIPITTRVHYGGVHNLAVIVNGIELASQEFELVVPD